jgi:hypothetical protein
MVTLSFLLPARVRHTPNLVEVKLAYLQWSLLLSIVHNLGVEFQE